MLTKAELEQEVAKIHWFHTMDLGQGVITKGHATPINADRLRLPDLSGKTVLDIGAFDGAYSFEAERRGAKRVLATDSFVWQGGWDTGKQGFELARRALGSRVEDLTIDVMDLSPERVGTFDVVLFLGVLYHLRYPLLALERIAKVTRELLVVETHLDAIDEPRPMMAFYPGKVLADDPTNWWGPNPSAVDAMLRDVGFPDVRMVDLWRSPDTYPWTGRERPGTDQQGRGIFHARQTLSISTSASASSRDQETSATRRQTLADGTTPHTSGSFTLSDQIIADLGVLHSLSELTKVSFTTHRPVIGRLVVAVKTVLRKLLTPILDRQSAYNGASLRVITYIRESIERLERRQAERLNTVSEQIAVLESRLSRHIASVEIETSRATGQAERPPHRD